MLKEKIAALNLPVFPSTREEAIEMLCREEYGYLPPKPISMTWEDEIIVPRFCAGTAPLHKVTLNCAMPNGKAFLFPFMLQFPLTEMRTPHFCI